MSDALAALIGKHKPNQSMSVGEARGILQLCDAYMQIYMCMPYELFERRKTALARIEMQETGIEPGDKYQDEAISYTDEEFRKIMQDGEK